MTAPAPEPGVPSRRAALLLPALLGALAFWLLYLPSLGFPFVWEDVDALGTGTVLRPSGETLAAFREPLHRIPGRGAAARQAYYRPIPVAALSLIDQAFGREPRHFRSYSVAAGALCAAAFGLLTGWLFGRAGPALFATLFAALHPVGIETAVWIVGAAASVSTLFTIAAVAFALASLRAARASAAAALGALSLVSLALALLSHERAVTTPLLLAAALLSLPVRRRAGAALGLVAAQALVVAGYALLLRPAVLGAALEGSPPIGGSAVTQVLTAVSSWPQQLAWIFAPIHSSTSDTVRVVATWQDPRVWLGALLALGSAAAWGWCLRARAGLAALGLAWIWIAFAPTSGVMPMLHARGERYLFLSTFGAALLLAGLAERFLPRAPRAWRRFAAPLAALLALSLLAERTRARLPDWSSTRALFERDVARDPAYREGYFVLGAEAFREQRFEEAKRWTAPLLADDPRFEGTAGYLNWLSLAELACNNAIWLGDYEAVLALDARWRASFPALAAAPSFRICLGLAFDGQERHADALRTYLGVAQELGADAAPRLYLMIARDSIQVGRPAQARVWLEKARLGAAGDAALAREIEDVSAYLDQLR